MAAVQISTVAIKRMTSSFNFRTSEIFHRSFTLTKKQEILFTYLYQFYQNNLIPEVLYVEKEIEGIDLLSESLGFDLKVPQRGRKKKTLFLAQQNAQQT